MATSSASLSSGASDVAVHRVVGAGARVPREGCGTRQPSSPRAGPRARGGSPPPSPRSRAGRSTRPRRRRPPAGRSSWTWRRGTRTPSPRAAAARSPRRGSGRQGRRRSGTGRPARQATRAHETRLPPVAARDRALPGENETQLGPLQSREPERVEQPRVVLVGPAVGWIQEEGLTLTVTRGEPFVVDAEVDRADALGWQPVPLEQGRPGVLGDRDQQPAAVHGPTVDGATIRELRAREERRIELVLQVVDGRHRGRAVDARDHHAEREVERSEVGAVEPAANGRRHRRRQRHRGNAARRRHSRPVLGDNGCREPVARIGGNRGDEDARTRARRPVRGHGRARAHTSRNLPRRRARASAGSARRASRERTDAYGAVTGWKYHAAMPDGGGHDGASAQALPSAEVDAVALFEHLREEIRRGGAGPQGARATWRAQAERMWPVSAERPYNGDLASRARSRIPSSGSCGLCSGGTSSRWRRSSARSTTLS